MRRPNGTGTIVKLSGTRRRPYAVRVSRRDQRGRLVQVALSYHATAAEAQAVLDKYNMDREAGRTPAADKLNVTVQEVFDAWSAREYKKLKPASVASHNAAWNKRISRYAAKKIREVTIDDWQAILDEDQDAGLSQSTINNDAILIKYLCAYAMERDMTAKNYSLYLDVPSVDPKLAKGSFTDIQIEQLRQMAAAGVPWADTVLILCYTGFRISEFLSLTRFNYHPENGGYLQGGTKTEAGRNRIVPVHKTIRPYLLSWLEKGGDTIICKDGAAIQPEWYRTHVFPSIVKELNVPQATPHWCRHTFATRLHAAGVDELSRKWLLGHKAASDVTDRYTHASINILVQAIGKLA